MNLNDFISFLEDSRGHITGSPFHRDLVENYNTIEPLPRNYKASIADPWCAIYVSAMWHIAMKGWFPYECSCTKMVALGQQQSRFFPRDELELAKSGYLIFYDWERDGSPDHVGYITEVDLYSNRYTVIDGNYTNRVSKRVIDIGARNIYGYISLVYPESSEKDSAKQWVIENQIMRGDGTADYWTTPPTREQLAVILMRMNNMS